MEGVINGLGGIWIIRDFYFLVGVRISRGEEIKIIKFCRVGFFGG